jgi:hypothetical protein
LILALVPRLTREFLAPAPALDAGYQDKKNNEIKFHKEN